MLILRYPGTKRFDSEKAGDREVQRTMLELLNQLDGFSSNDDIKVPISPLSCLSPLLNPLDISRLFFLLLILSVHGSHHYAIKNQRKT